MSGLTKKLSFASSLAVVTSTGSGVPSKRYWHSAVFTGAQMIVWGGKEAAAPGVKEDRQAWQPT